MHQGELERPGSPAATLFSFEGYFMDRVGMIY
jgi:hypothetical protein